MPQRVRVHLVRQSQLARPELQARLHRAGAQRLAVAPDEQRLLAGARELPAHRLSLIHI